MNKVIDGLVQINYFHNLTCNLSGTKSEPALSIRDMIFFELEDVVQI